MLRIHNLTKSFEGQANPILRGLNLEVAAGEFCVVIGNNGSGKSTLLKTLVGDYQVNQGTISIGEIEVTHADRAKTITYVAQDPQHATIGQLTLFENMVLSLLRGKNATFSMYAAYQSQVLKLLAGLPVDLTNYLNQPLAHLSGGQRQMVATLMAFAGNPQLVLLDEHTSALDPAAQTMLMEYTDREISKYGITTLMVTHKLEDALQYGSRLIMLAGGNVVFDTAGDAKRSLTMSQLLNLFYCRCLLRDARAQICTSGACL